MRIQIIMATVIILVLAVFRLLPHLPNISPVATMALFGGAVFANKKMAFIIPLMALFISDIVMGLHNTMLFVYAGFAITVVMGLWLKNKLSITTVALASIASSVIFFLLTNFGSWLMSGLYPQTSNGLLQAYMAGIPFFQNSLLGNLFFSGFVFGLYAVIFSTKQSARAPYK